VVGRVCADQDVGGAGSDPHAGWIATPDVIEVDAPDPDGAGANVRVILPPAPVAPRR